MLSDLRLALRQLRKAPGFAAVAVLTLALGIGACTALFSVVDGVLLRPLPYPGSDRLVMVRETLLPDFPSFSVSPGNYSSWKSAAQSFESLAAFHGASYALTGRGEPARIDAVRATGNYLSTLGLRPALGRDFAPEEDSPGGAAVVLLGHGFWQRQFGGREDALGQTLQLDGKPFTVVGVLPPAFRDADLLTPTALSAADLQNHGNHYLRVVGRLRAGTTREAAQAELAGIAAALTKQFPNSNKGWSVRTYDLLDWTVGGVRPVLWALLGAVAFLLLIGCANVANLQLARAAARHREFAVRSALGASRPRIARQLLTESLLLALLGGFFGVMVAQWGVGGLLALAPENLPRAEEIAVDGRALLFAALATGLTTLVSGLAPALRSSRVDLQPALAESSRTATGRHSRLRNALVVAEVAVALVLLIGAGLLLRSFARLQSVDPGFEPGGAYSFAVNLPSPGYRRPAKQAAFAAQATAALAALPGVAEVGAVTTVPFGGNDSVLSYYREDRPRPEPGRMSNAYYYAATPGYFRALGLRLLRGRVFDDHDTADSRPVAIVSESLAKQAFGDADPLGKRFFLSNSDKRCPEIVGIVADTKHYGLEDSALAQLYEPFAQSPGSFCDLVLRTAGPQPLSAAGIAAAIHAIDPSLPVQGFASMETRLGRSVAGQRFAALLFAVFSSIALVLAAIGIYGVVSYAVGQRTPEIGIRMALGARRETILRLVLAQGSRLVALGLALGVGGAVLLTRLLSSLLFGVSPHDPATYAALVAVLGLVGALACWLPARRATRVDPLVALRSE